MSLVGLRMGAHVAQIDVYGKLNMLEKSVKMVQSEKQNLRRKGRRKRGEKKRRIRRKMQLLEPFLTSIFLPYVIPNPWISTSLEEFLLCILGL